MGRSLLIAALVPWLAACNYTFLSGVEDGGVDSAVDSAPDPDGAPDTDATPNCGNGTLEPGEQCDDGNQTNGDGCAASCQVECCNGSTIDCNFTSWGTVNPAAAFVDPSPPAGFCQCAGFENTPAYDVAFDWEANCLGIATVLRLRYWDTATLPWTLLGDATLNPASLPDYETQTFDASNHDGIEGVLEHQGLRLLKDDPAASDYFWESCEVSGPMGYLYQFNDMLFANQANDKVVWVCSASNHEPCDPEHELRMGNIPFGECVAPPHYYDLAIALYREAP